MTQIYIKQNIHKQQTQNFRRISPFGITPVEKAHKARTRWYRGPFRRFINTRSKKCIKKEWTEELICLILTFDGEIFFRKFRFRLEEMVTLTEYTAWAIAISSCNNSQI